MFMLNLYKNRKNIKNKHESLILYPEAGSVSKSLAVPFLIVDMLSYLSSQSLVDAGLK
jgi:hypothetical protein